MDSGFVPGIIHAMGVLAVFLSFLPLILYWYRGLAENKSFMVIAIYWLINGVIYAPEIFRWEWYVPVDEQITLYYNLMDAPLIIFFFYYAFEKKIFLWLILFFVIFEAFVILITGFNLTSNFIIIGVGSLFCLGLNMWGMLKYFRQVNHNRTEKAYLFIFAGFIFYYGLCVDLIYIFKIFHFDSAQKKYESLINYSAMLLGSGLISYAFCKLAEPGYQKNDRTPARELM